MSEKWSKWMRWTDVKCPHCGLQHDVTKFDYLILPSNQKPVFSCEKKDDDGAEIGCGKRFQVVQVDQPILVRVRKAKDDAGEFKNVQTDEEREKFEKSAAWAEMQRKGQR